MINKFRLHLARRKRRAESKRSPRIWRLAPNWPAYCLWVVILLCPLVSWSWKSSLNFGLPKNFYSLEVPPPMAFAAGGAEAASFKSIQQTTPLPSSSPIITFYPGSAHSGYSYGQCTYYVASRRAIPGNWGNASNWYGRAQRAGYRVGSTPAVGAIGWTPSGWYGHVVLVEQVVGDKVYIAEMNNYGIRGGGWNRVDHRWVPANAFKYIY